MASLKVTVRLIANGGLISLNKILNPDLNNDIATALPISPAPLIQITYLN
jgi:hypothetical protein